MHTKLQKLEQANQHLQLENDRLTAKVRELEALTRRLEVAPGRMFFSTVDWHTPRPTGPIGQAGQQR